MQRSAEPLAAVQAIDTPLDLHHMAGRVRHAIREGVITP